MRYAGDVSSGAICIKSAEAERPAGPAIADIQPHCKMIQQCLKTSLQFKETESGPRNPICHCSEVRNMNSHAKFLSHSLIVPVGLHHECNPDNKIMVYVLLDDQSNFCFTKTSAIEKLNLHGPEVHLKLSTVLAKEDITSEKITGLVVCGVNESTYICLSRTYTRDIIPAKRSQIPRPETAPKWPHLKRIADMYNLMPYKEEVDVALLLGINCARAIKPREIIKGNNNDPYAKRTALGWGVVGMVEPDTYKGEESVGVNRVAAYEVPFSPKKMCHFVLKTHTKEICLQKYIDFSICLVLTMMFRVHKFGFVIQK